MSTEFEKIVPGAHPVKAEQFSPDLRDLTLDFVTRLDIIFVKFGAFV